MEVHHHPHVEKKKFKEYFLEFLMIFLAVTLGFFAENLREHSVENKRGAEYAKTLIQDLIKDTAEINGVINDQQIAMVSTDSIGALIQKYKSGELIPASFYYFSNTSTIAPVVAWNKSTLLQLIQSGNLRYFHNKELVNKLSFYYSQSDYISTIVENDRIKRDAAITIRNRIVIHSIFSKYSTFYSEKWMQLPDSMMNKRVALLNSDEKVLNEFANSLESRKRTLNLLINTVYPVMIKRAKELIDMLEEEY